MKKIVINGGRELYGTVPINGSKNAVVAIIPATILSGGVCRIENVPRIGDVFTLIDIMTDIGAKVRWIDSQTLEIDATAVDCHVATGNAVSKMRGSYYFMGAMLGRFHQADVGMPGGDNFDFRPINEHLKGFNLLGAEYSITKDIIHLKTDALKGASIRFDVQSVGATINVMLAAVLAEGRTTIYSAAQEPHVVDVANFLSSMGAEIRGAGTDVIKIDGVKSLHGSTYTIIPDQIEAGTFMAAVANTGGDLTLTNVIPWHLRFITDKLRETGVTVEEGDDTIRVIRSKESLRRVDIITRAHPGFPTDMQPQFGTLMTTASGISRVREEVWDNRLKYLLELQRMGASVRIEDKKNAIITGVERLKGSIVSAVDLRAGAALVIAGLAADGVTEVLRVDQIERGYEDIVGKLKRVGADIEMVIIEEQEVKPPESSAG